MSSAVSPIANAVVAYSTFDSLGLRRTGQYVVGSLICFWNSQNTKKNGEFMGITLLLLDELNSLHTQPLYIHRLSISEDIFLALRQKLAETTKGQVLDVQPGQATLQQHCDAVKRAMGVEEANNLGLRNLILLEPGRFKGIRELPWDLPGCLIGRFFIGLESSSKVGYSQMDGLRNL
ncbi:hypothetical protein F2Q68_00036380 [Brassica cretica]|uniref:Uncharacterized protein n=1 Tax=Brassica cretica TaxID=69181 RepID=A0A8S9H157_BRACR|nr:hypothetical protein F2Q68_00036380 [Brassica cretica]